MIANYDFEVQGRTDDNRKKIFDMLYGWNMFVQEVCFLCSSWYVNRTMRLSIAAKLLP